ncbi:unnamed protein product [Enterobius vermicularis]|uniref:SAM domain-containing protein n=1 Tax=Enterobius vermicularis TaxID=51028 RepID=A0A0N4UYE7_ENTVE|nr:unnamed protein product [Enterobius vermicularis]
MANSILAIKWERFFVDVEIPEKIAAEYAKKFAEQRVQFEMRGELTRNLLVELGIKALGDQMAILHYLKREKEKTSDGMDTNESYPLSSNTVLKQEPASNVLKRGLKPPDRDDIYHIRMPSGSTPKTREILRKQNLLRSAGRLMKRGINGIRKSGEEVKPHSKILVSRFTSGSTSSAGLTLLKTKTWSSL